MVTQPSDTDGAEAQTEDLVDVVEDLVERVDDLEGRVDDLEQERDELRSDLQEERARRKDLEQRVDETATLEWDTSDHSDLFVESTEGARYPLGRALASKPAETDVETLIEEMLEDVDVQDEPGTSADEDLLPIQQLARMPESAARDHLDNGAQRNTFRARAVWKDLGDYASRTPKGLVLRSGELTRVLNALEDGEATIESRTALRVMERIQELSKDVVDRRKQDGEWMLVVPHDFQERAKAASDEVVTG